jgi:hypothetical protein
MGEVVNVLVAFAVIVFIFRWATSGMYNLLPRSSHLSLYLVHATSYVLILTFWLLVRR